MGQSLSVSSAIVGGMLGELTYWLTMQITHGGSAPKFVSAAVAASCLLSPLVYALICGFRAVIEMRRIPSHNGWQAIVGIIVSSLFLSIGLLMLAYIIRL